MLLLLWWLVERRLLGGDLQHKSRIEPLALSPIVAELVRCHDRLLDLLPVIEVCVPVQPRLSTTVSFASVCTLTHRDGLAKEVLQRGGEAVIAAAFVLVEAWVRNLLHGGRIVRQH